MTRLLTLLAGLIAATPALAADFTLTAGDFADGGRLPDAQVFDGFGCSGGNRSPALSWSGAPAGTESFALTVYDPDAPTGSGFWHWVMFDIPAGTTALAAGAGEPEGAKEARNDYGRPGYGGACPPPGPAHHYVFTVWALPTATLGLDADATPAMVGFMLHGNALAKATLTATYGR